MGVGFGDSTPPLIGNIATSKGDDVAVGYGGGRLVGGRLVRKREFGEMETYINGVGIEERHDFSRWVVGDGVGDSLLMLLI